MGSWIKSLCISLREIQESLTTSLKGHRGIASTDGLSEIWNQEPEALELGQMTEISDPMMGDSTSP